LCEACFDGEVVEEIVDFGPKRQFCELFGHKFCLVRGHTGKSKKRSKLLLYRYFGTFRRFALRLELRGEWDRQGHLTGKVGFGKASGKGFRFVAFG